MPEIVYLYEGGKKREWGYPADGYIFKPYTGNLPLDATEKQIQTFVEAFVLSV